jgi:hypothetical protein
LPQNFEGRIGTYPFVSWKNDPAILSPFEDRWIHETAMETFLEVIAKNKNAFIFNTAYS